MRRESRSHVLNCDYLLDQQVVFFIYSSFFFCGGGRGEGGGVELGSFSQY